LAGYPASLKIVAAPLRIVKTAHIIASALESNKAPLLTRLRAYRNTGGFMTPERGVDAASADGVVVYATEKVTFKRTKTDIHTLPSVA
jgi:hypothetical protein